LDIKIVVVDLDIVFASDPFLLLDEGPFSSLDIFLQSEYGNPEEAHAEAYVDIGFYCLAPTDPAKRFVDLWLQDLSRYDQGVAQDLLRFQVVPELKWAVLPTSTAASLCHVDGHWRWRTDYVQNFESYLLDHEDLLRDMVVFHFPCLSSERTTHKYAMAGLLLHELARLSS